MSLRTGMLRLGTVIRGCGWVVAALILVVGIVRLTEDLHRVDSEVREVRSRVASDDRSANYFDRFDAPRLSADQVTQRVEDIRSEAYKNRLSGALVVVVMMGLAIGIAYGIAWVFVGFAPDR